MTRWTSTLSVLLLVGCATSTEQKQSELPALAVVAPFNFDRVTPEQLKPGLGRSGKMLDLFLRHNKAEVVTIPPEEFETAYLEALDGKHPPPIDSAAHSQLMGALLEKLSPRPAESVLIVPHLIYRNAELIGMKGKWDGVVRKVVVENFFENLDAQFQDKTSTGVSLRIQIFSQEAGLAHQGYGGIELPFKFVGHVRGRTYYPVFTQRDGKEIFADPKAIARAISVAFSPYIPRAI